jgi:perosamine synthetase
LALGVGPGDEVIVPTLTYVATANSVVYCGAQPVFVDSEPQTWNMDPCLIEDRITPHTKGIIVVHIYGHPVDLDPIMETARRHGLFVIEDAAEAHGAEYKGRRVGAFGDISTFSFYGNKIITTGEGGMVCTNDEALMRRLSVLKGQGQDPERRYWFPTVGYNYRMTNVAAAIGLAQLEMIDWHLARRREVASWYREQLRGLPLVSFSPELAWARSSFWLSSVVLEPDAVDRDRVMRRMLERGVETRPFFYPMHILPRFVREDASFPVADRLGRQGINLPSSAALTYSQVEQVVAELARAMEL